MDHLVKKDQARGAQLEILFVNRMDLNMLNSLEQKMVIWTLLKESLSKYQNNEYTQCTLLIPDTVRRSLPHKAFTDRLCLLVRRSLVSIPGLGGRFQLKLKYAIHVNSPETFLCCKVLHPTRSKLNFRV